MSGRPETAAGSAPIAVSSMVRRRYSPITNPVLDDENIEDGADAGRSFTVRAQFVKNSTTAPQTAESRLSHWSVLTC